MILGGKLPGKVGRCRFFLVQNIFTIQRKDSSYAVFFLSVKYNNKLKIDN